MNRRPFIRRDSRPRPGHRLARPTAFEPDLRFEVLEDRRLLTGVPESLGDLNPGGPSDPDKFVNAGGTVFFSGDNGTNGSELWRTGGTIASTMMVKDIGPLAAGSSPTELTAVGGTLFFAADDGSNGVELWKSDGTSAGTVMVKNINPGGSSSPGELTNVNGTLYFRADDGTNGVELWKSDGTSAGTTMVMDIHSTADSDPRYLISVGGKLFFSADDGISGRELWLSDPGTSSTMMVKDINPGSDGSTPGTFRSLAEVGGILYFSAFDVANGFELWKSDGTMGGTTLVEDIRPGDASSFPFVMANVGGTLYFTADDGSTGFELWKTNGMPGGTTQVKDINPTAGVGSGADGLTNVGGALFFRANDGTNGVELWKSNGTSIGTMMVLDINTSGDSAPRYLTNVGGTLYFQANEGTTVGLTGTELWQSDGTPGGTTLVADIAAATDSSKPQGLANVTGTLFFSAENMANNREPWILRGPTASVVATHLFYNDSKFDNTTPAADASDDNAIATDKVAYLPLSGPATFANVTSNSKGINGVMIDLAGPIGSLSADDLTLQNGTSNTPGGWPLAPAPVEIAVRAGAGVSGSDRVELIWANGAIQKTWLQVTVKANFNTNLAAPYTFLFGNAVGDSGMGNSAVSAITGAIDEVFARDSIGLGASVTNLADYNRDGLVSAFDQVVSRDNVGVLPLLNVATTVVGRLIFYNHSVFDGNNSAINAADDAAIATDKVAYLPGGGAAGESSVSSSLRGINGVMVDVANASGTITAADFTFKLGDNNTPSTWAAAPAPSAVSVRPGAGVSGSDRVELIWNDGVIANAWLEVIVEGNDAAGGFNTNTGLAASDIFFFGSRIGDTLTDGLPGSFLTSALDETAVAANSGFGATITNIFDFSRDGLVSSFDQTIARDNNGSITRIDIASPPAAPAAEPQSSNGAGSAASGGLFDAIASSLAAEANDSGGTFGPTRRPVGRLSQPAALQPIDRSIHEAADDDSPGARSIRAAIEQISDSPVPDDELLDELIAGLDLQDPPSPGRAAR